MAEHVGVVGQNEHVTGIIRPRPFESVARDTAIRRNARSFGPEPDDDCPCGSRRKARSCHRAPDHSWVAAPPRPLLTGRRTGYANRRCYGRASNDCSEAITREHWISEAVLEHVRDQDSGVVVGGMTWLAKGETKQIGIGALTSRILCDRHNFALSPLDAMAGQFFAAMRDDGRSLIDHGPEGEFPCAFTMISGPMLELWLLKVLWGAAETGTVRLGESVAYRFRLGVTTTQLAEILWRGAPWPKHWGLYVPAPSTPLERATKMGSTEIRFVFAGPEILGGGMVFAGIDFLLAFERPDVPTVYRPGALTFQRRDYRNWKMMALCWPDAGHTPINVKSERGRGDDPYTRPPPSRQGVLDLGQFRR